MLTFIFKPNFILLFSTLKRARFGKQKSRISHTDKQTNKKDNAML